MLLLLRRTTASEALAICSADAIPAAALVVFQLLTPILHLGVGWLLLHVETPAPTLVVPPMLAAAMPSAIDGMQYSCCDHGCLFEGP